MISFALTKPEQDRNAIALARLNTLEEDLNLTSTQYQTCVAVLFAGYVIVGIPANMVVTRVRPSLWMASCMTVWAIISCLTAVSRNYTGLLLTRFFLGVTEAPYYPGALYILATFYTRKELATRISILYTGNILATAFAGLIALGIFKMHGLVSQMSREPNRFSRWCRFGSMLTLYKGGIAGWQWLFILQGAVTLVVALAAFFILPNEPLNTHWLTPDERTLAHERTQRDTVGNAGNTTSWKGVLEAAKDPKVWLFVFMQHCHLGANGFKNFFPTAIETLGFSQTITLVLTCPPYLVAGVISIAWSWSSGKFNERTW